MKRKRLLKISFRFSKRKKIVLISLFLSFLFWLSQNLTFSALFLGFTVLTVYLASLWVMDFDLKGEEYLAFPLVPIIFHLSLLSFFLFFLKLNIKWFGFLFYLMGIYISLLTINILNVATVKILPLARVAYTTLRLLTIISSFMFFCSFFIFDLSIFRLLSLIFLASFSLSYPSFWWRKQGRGWGIKTVFYSLLTALCAIEFAWVLIFWPLSLFLKGVALTAILYIITELISHYLNATMTKRAVREYILVATSVSFLLIVVANWGAF